MQRSYVVLLKILSVKMCSNACTLQTMEYLLCWGRMQFGTFPFDFQEIVKSYLWEQYAEWYNIIHDAATTTAKPAAAAVAVAKIESLCVFLCRKICRRWESCQFLRGPILTLLFLIYVVMAGTLSRCATVFTTKFNLQQIQNIKKMEKRKMFAYYMMYIRSYESQWFSLSSNNICVCVCSYRYLPQHTVNSIFSFLY